MFYGCHRMLRVGGVGLAALIAGCSDGSGSSQGGGTSTPARAIVSAAPKPAEMCEANTAPALAAYALEDGTFRWAVCSSDDARRDVLEASEEVVHLAADQTVVAYHAGTGTELPSAPPPPNTSTDFGVTADGRSTIDVDGIRIEGGQDDPTTAVDAATGEQLWTQPGSPAYDDMWAVGDGGVYLVDRSTSSGPRLVAYELKSGAIRWERGPIDPYGADVGWPWSVSGNVLFTIWSNLALISTEDGSTLWRTDYPKVEFPRMTGVRANGDTVFVAFSSVRSGGD